MPPTRRRRSPRASKIYTVSEKASGSRTAACRCASRFSRRATGHSRSPTTWRCSGARLIRSSSRNYREDIPSTSGGRRYKAKSPERIRAPGFSTRLQRAAVDEYAPERIKLPGGRTVKIAYAADAPPTIAARIQDLYGVREGFWIANRRVPVRIQILAPSNRPLQVTDNLALFWRETYPKLKPQLQRRYPKHEWR